MKELLPNYSKQGRREGRKEKLLNGKLAKQTCHKKRASVQIHANAMDDNIAMENKKKKTKKKINRVRYT